MVYDFTLTENRQPVLVDQWNVDAPWGRSPPMSLPKLSTGLTGVCHKIREEIGHSYYILNGFRFIQPSTLIDWLRDPNRRDNLRSIACRLNLDSTWFKSSCEVLRLLHLCASLVTLRINANPADLRILQHFEKFKTLHGFASAEAILFPQGDPDDSHLWPASSVHIWTRQHDPQPILAQLRSRCPDNCAGHARRERMEIRVMPSNMSPW